MYVYINNVVEVVFIIEYKKKKVNYKFNVMNPTYNLYNEK
jgi:hypothetical protein